VGGMLAPLCAIWLATQYGWRWAFVVTGALGFLWIPLWLFTARRAPRYQGAEPTEKVSSAGLLRDRRQWAFILATALGMTPYALWFNWIVVYLTTANGLTLQQAAFPASLPPLFANLGGLAGGWISFRLVRRGATAVESRRRACFLSAVMLLATAAVPLLPGAVLATAGISFSLFWAASFSVNVYTLPLDVFGRARAAFSVSLLTGAYGLMAAAFSPLTGYWVDHWGFGPVCVLVGVLPLAGYGVLHFAASDTIADPQQQEAT
jgi:MFS transporter, ACS family, hexuronate transporter